MARKRGTSKRDVLNGTNGPDQLFGLGGNDVLNGRSGNDRLDGGVGNDTLNGAAGNDTLIGGAGNDRMVGGTGNDTYYWNRGDTIVETATGGSDTVFVNDRSLTFFQLANNVENLTVLDAEINARFNGNASNNVIDGSGTFGLFYGFAGNDDITGGSGVDADDYIDGGEGQDTMRGLGGEDTYIVDDVGDVVIEVNLVGNDRIRSSVDYTLPQYVEILELTGADAIDATGRDGDEEDETLIGNTGANRLTGHEGRDNLTGGLGGDFFVYTHIDDSTFRITGSVDRILDFDASEGDRIDLTLIGGTLSYIDEAAFSAPGQVRVIEGYSLLGTDGLLVQVNTAGTGSAEMDIFLVNAVGADLSWFAI